MVAVAVVLGALQGRCVEKSGENSGEKAGEGWRKRPGGAWTADPAPPGDAFYVDFLCIVELLL